MKEKQSSCTSRERKIPLSDGGQQGSILALSDMCKLSATDGCIDLPPVAVFAYLIGGRLQIHIFVATGSVFLYNI